MDRIINSGWMARLGLAAAFSLAVLFTTAPAAWAGNHDATCADGSMGSCMDEMLAEQSGLLDEVEGLILDLSAMGLLSDVRSQSGHDATEDLMIEVANLRDENRRARDTNDAIADSEYDDAWEQGDTEKGGACKLSDRPAFESLEGDFSSIGLSAVNASKFPNDKCDVWKGTDTDGNEVRINERKENLCEMVCTEKKNAGGNSRKGESKARFNETMLNGISSASSARQAMAIQRVHINQLATLWSDVSTLTSHGNTCTPGVNEPGEELLLALRKQNTVVVMDITIFIAEGVEVATGAIHGIADAITKQDAVGFNSSTAGIVTTVIHHLAQGTKTVLNGVKNTIVNKLEKDQLNVQYDNSYLADSAAECRYQISQDTESLKLSAGDTADALAVIQADMAVLRTLVEENRALLLTPQGRRDGFAAK